MTYLKTLHLKIQRGRDDIIQVWMDLIFIMQWRSRPGHKVCGTLSKFPNFNDNGQVSFL